VTGKGRFQMSILSLGHGMKTLAVNVCCALLCSTPLFAREKSDMLVMNNGDRMTCEIKGLSSGILYVSVDYIQGTTSVDWSKVHHLESKQLFVVKTEDGSSYTGTLSTASTGGARPLQIEVAENAEKNAVLEQQKIVTIDETSNHVWQRFNGSFNSGLIYSKGNQSTQFTLGAQVQYPRERWSAGASFDSTLAGSTGVTTSTRDDGLLYFRRTLRWNNWFYTGVSDFLQSSEQSIDLQSNLAGGVGRYVKNTNRARIAVVGGIAWQNTRYSQSPAALGSQNVGAVLVGAQAQLFKFDKTNLTVSANAFPALSQPGRVYINTNVSYYVKFFSNFTWNFSFYGNWDNQPPSHLSGSDYGTSSGLGWTFGNK
jgi:Protein of unknown function, DUF481